MASIEAWTQNLNSLKEAFRQAEEAYHALKSRLEGNQTLLSDQRERLANTIQTRQQALAAYTKKLSECDFPDEGASHSALKTESKISELKHSIDQYQNEVQAVEQDLRRLNKETENKQKQDIELLEIAKQKLEQEKRQADESIQTLIARLGINESIAKALVRAISDATVYQQEYLPLSNLSKTANKRLKIMTNSRFELLRREDAADLRSQTGLEIDTLFIDEGFGALDTESLEQAIQTLVGLAAGNRLVGIISHVSELKERIDRQVVIKKSNSGSSIHLIS